MNAPSQTVGDGILFEILDRIMTITFDRPHILNAFSYPMLTAFLHALKQADEDPQVGAIIVTGHGRAFSAGTDISQDPDGFERSKQTTLLGACEPDFGGLITLQMFKSSKPIIAAINGAAVGFGSTLVLPMDVRIASPNAYFSYIFTRRGLMPEACSTWFLPRVVGITRALDWSLSGRNVSAQEAKEAGLLTDLVPEGELQAYARNAALMLIESTSPTSLAVCRRAMWAMLAAPGPETAHELESEGMSMLRSSDDFLEAMGSFREKRPAIFSPEVDANISSRISRLIENL
jgi:enoyl-CoA hydratase/carnithine racemase